jgi:hypothetical protein
MISNFLLKNTANLWTVLIAARNIALPKSPLKMGLFLKYPTMSRDISRDAKHRAPT